MEPTPYNLDDPDEAKRLMRELKGYMHVSLNDGTDIDGRHFAFDALREIVDNDYGVSIDTEPFEPPTVGNEII